MHARRRLRTDGGLDPADVVEGRAVDVVAAARDVDDPGRLEEILESEERGDDRRAVKRQLRNRIESLSAGAVDESDGESESTASVSTPTSTSTSASVDETAATAESATDEAPDSDGDSPAAYRERVDRAEHARHSAEEARDQDDLEAAVQAYDAALEEYEAALDVAPEGESQNVEDAMTAVRASREEVVELRDSRADLPERTLTELEETLERAERFFLDGIVAHANGESVSGKIRYRRARNQFDAARDLLADADDPEALLDAVDVRPGEGSDLDEVPSDVADLPGVGSETADAFAELGVETVADLADADAETREAIRDHADVDEETAARLVALTWWTDPAATDVSDRETLDARYERAADGFRACV